MFECCLDESGTHGESQTAVLGGLLLRREDFSWLDLAWAKLLDDHGLDAIHMREFTPHGRMRHVRHQARRLLFADVARTINRHKHFTVSATLTPDQYERHFGGLVQKEHKMSIYAACFLLVTVIQTKHAQYHNYKGKINFLLDEGNQHKDHVLNSYEFMLERPSIYSNMGTLAFCSDSEQRVLQAADVIAWSVRKRLTGEFKHGFEPLSELFAEDHMEQPFEAAWMGEIADSLRAKRDERMDG
jgi:hypothetical protein